MEFKLKATSMKPKALSFICLFWLIPFAIIIFAASELQGETLSDKHLARYEEASDFEGKGELFLSCTGDSVGSAASTGACSLKNRDRKWLQVD